VDFSGDSRLDLAVANSGENSATILAGLGDGTFTRATDVSLSAAPFALATADLDGDGRADVVSVNPAANTASAIINASTATNLPATNVAGAEQAYPAAVFEDIGVKVRATPRLHPNHEVTIKVAIELKSISVATFNGIPVINNRSVEQTTRLREGETTMISGIISTDASSTLSGWPWTSSVPGFGLATGNINQQPRETELIIAITPRRLRLAPRKDRLIYAGKTGEGAAPPPSEPPQ